MRRGHRLPKDPIGREVAFDSACNLSADNELGRASRIMERNFIRKGDPS